MATASKLPKDPKLSSAEKGREGYLTDLPSPSSRSSSPDSTSIKVEETEEQKASRQGTNILSAAIRGELTPSTGKGRKKTRKSKKSQRKTKKHLRRK